MRAKVLTLVCCFVLGTFVASPAAQPSTAKPGPEHEMLKEKFEGDWDASMDFGGNKSKGTARYKMGIGGFWLLMDFTGDFAGAKFEGKGATGYDPVKKKYVGTWIDTMTPHLMLNLHRDRRGHRCRGQNAEVKIGLRVQGQGHDHLHDVHDHGRQGAESLRDHVHEEKVTKRKGPAASARLGHCPYR